MITNLILLFGLWGAAVAEEPVQSVELTLQTRGTRKSITVDAQQTRVDINGQTRQVRTQPKQWAAIKSALRAVNLADLPALPTDVSRSSRDAALSARVRVTANGQTYESAPYDHPNPPVPIARLVAAVVGSAPAASRAEFD